MSAIAGAVDLERLDALARSGGLELVADAPMAPLTTLRVGGPADRLATAHSRDELLAVLRIARQAQVPWMVVGNGSDVVVADAGVRGLVIRNRSRTVTISGAELTADSGVPLALLVKRCTSAGLAGMEFGISIPGTFGGAVWANAGAHGGEIRDVLTWAEAWDPASDEVRMFENAACQFGYRESRFKHLDEVILSAQLHLEPGDRSAIAERVAAHHAARAASQPLADQNAGSVFRNPPGDHAGRLIDVAGLKGMRVGTASVSTVHANFITSDRGGRAADIRELADRVRATVRQRFGVELQYEIEFVGAWPADVSGAAS